MAVCPACRSQVEDGERYCGNCGLDLTRQGTQAGTPSSAQAEQPVPTTTFSRVFKFLKEDNWPIRMNKESDFLSCRFKGNNGIIWEFSALIISNEIVVFSSAADFVVPPDKINQTMEYISRANWGLVFGNFVLDMKNREVVFRTSIALESDEDLTTGIIKRAVYMNVSAMDQYLPGLLDVIYHGVTPQDAIAKAEG